MSCKTLVVRDYGHKENSLTILQISDLHGELYGPNQDRLVDKVTSLNPDVIFYTGDIFECYSRNPSSCANVELLLSRLNHIPSFYITGNHEYMDLSEKEGKSLGLGPDYYKSIMAQYGIKVLSDERVVIKLKGYTLNIVGVEDPVKDAVVHTKYFDRLKEVSVMEEGINILLAHRPEFIKEYKKYDYDLIFSGHFHGGQWRLPPLIKSFYAPEVGFFPRYAGGRYTFSRTSFYVSRGLSIHYPPVPRIFNNPELVVVRID